MDTNPEIELTINVSEVTFIRPIDQLVAKAFEDALVGIDAKETLTADEEAALCYRSGVGLTLTSDNKLKTAQPCAVTRVNGKWFVAIGQNPRQD